MPFNIDVIINNIIINRVIFTSTHYKIDRVSSITHLGLLKMQIIFFASENSVFNV